MIKDALPDEHQPKPFEQLHESQLNVEQAQIIIYRYFLYLTKNWTPESVLGEFNKLFIYPVNAFNSETLKALCEIVFDNNENAFRNTLKRTCYILLNNWCLTRRYNYIQKFFELFEQINKYEYTSSLPLSQLKSWLINFSNSKDFQELKLFSSVGKPKEKNDWTHRYTSYLLAPQYLDPKNPIEQRKAAQQLAKQLKEKFKFELAMYTAHSQSSLIKHTKYKNPTLLGDEALRLIKRILVKRGLFSYPNLANIFLQQNHQVSYKTFKQNLQKYLIYSVAVETKSLVQTFNTQLAKNLDDLYEQYHEETLNEHLLLRTCNQVINYLTTDNQHRPSSLFVLLTSHGEILTLAIILLKVFLICKNTRSHLESRIANLIRYYENYSEEECQSIITFFEVFNMTFTIYAENVQYNLVNIKDNNGNDDSVTDLDAYRIFSQLKYDLNIADDDLSDTSWMTDTLSITDLTDAGLNDAKSNNGKVENVDLGNNLRIPQDKKLRLKRQGAIFEGFGQA